MHKSRAATSAAWRAWAPRVAARIGGVALGGVGTAATLGYYGVKVAMALRKKAMKKQTRRRSYPRMGMAPVPMAVKGMKRKRSVGPLGRVKKPRYARKRTTGNREVRRNPVSVVASAVRSSRLLSALVQPCRILRFSGMNVMDVSKAGHYASTTVGTDLPGFFAMRRESATSSSFPYYIFNLNNAPNAGTTTYAPFRTAVMGATGDITFSGCNGSNTAGGDSTAWQYEYLSGPNAGVSTAGVVTAPSASWIQPVWYDVRMVLYGAVNSQTTFDIQYVELAEEWADPFAVTAEPKQAFERNAFYAQELRTIVTNPIASTVKKLSRVGFKVLQSWSYTIAPNLSIDSDATPNSEVVRFFIRDGRCLRYYDQTDTTTAGGFNQTTEAQLRDPNQFTPSDNLSRIYNTYPQPQKRQRFIVIKSINTLSTATASVSSNNTPSFDLLVRKKEFISDV